MVENIITLLVGAATFIIGMNMMSSGLKKSTGKGVKNLFKKLQNNRLAGLGIGAGVTALIQSSAATSVMTIGFISAGVMTIFQGISVILGAYIGTTITGVLVSLSSLDFAKYFVLLAVVGVVMMFFSNEKCKNIGEILAGLGLLFFGLSTMTSAFRVGNETTELLNVFQTFFTGVEKLNIAPILFLLLGAIFTALIQSSSATSGIVIIMVGSGAIQTSSGLFLVLGATIGTVITTILASIGGNTNVKRTAIICLCIRIFTALLAVAIIWPLESNGYLVSNFFVNTFGNAELGLAMFLVLYNVVFMMLILPFLNPIISLFSKLIKGKEDEMKKKVILYIDPLLLKNPDIALMQVNKEIIHMFDLSFENFTKGYNCITNHTLKDKEFIVNTEDSIDLINNEVTNFLISLGNKVSDKNEKLIGSYFHIINDIERIGDHAYNFLESYEKMKENDLKFSDIAKEEFEEMNKPIQEMFVLVREALIECACKNITKLHKLENETDKLKITLSAAHFDRITNKTCHIELSPFYSTFISELERVADHLVNIGYAFINPTGDEI